MKEYLKSLKIWLWVFSILLVLWAVTFFVIKSRTPTDPDLWDNGSSLYTSVNETLTAAKRNALVKKATKTREDAFTGDTTLFDMNCERRFQGKWSNGNIVWFYNSLLNYWWTSINTPGNTCVRTVSNTSKNAISVSPSDWVTRTMQKLQKKCQ